MSNQLRARLHRLDLFLDLYPDLPPNWQQRVERELISVLELLLRL